jgi:hypothetical protein
MAVGLGFCFIDLVAAGMVMGMIPSVHPMILEQMPIPGVFLR